LYRLSLSIFLGLLQRKLRPLGILLRDLLLLDRLGKIRAKLEIHD
jgi:hypothetical protein